MTVFRLIITIERHMIVHIVKPHIPDTSGDWAIITSIIFMLTRINRTSSPDLPGYDSGGMIKLSQLTMTIIVVGK